MKILETELRLDILPQTMTKDLENIVDLDHELHKPSGVERKRNELENNQNSGIVISSTYCLKYNLLLLPEVASGGLWTATVMLVTVLHDVGDRIIILVTFSM